MDIDLALVDAIIKRHDVEEYLVQVGDQLQFLVDAEVDECGL